MALNGALAGLAAITAGPDTSSTLGATLIGGILAVFSINALDKVFKIDDPVGAISVHGVVGLWGLLAVPLTNIGVSFSGQLGGKRSRSNLYLGIWHFNSVVVNT